MKHWTQINFKPQLKEEKKQIWLEGRKITDLNLTEEGKYSLELKYRQPIWHHWTEILRWLKREQLANRIPITHPKGEVERKTLQLVKKELLKDKNNKDHLVLTFKDYNKEFVVFPSYFKKYKRWNSLTEGDSYHLTYVKQIDHPENKDILIWFEKVEV